MRAGLAAVGEAVRRRRRPRRGAAARLAGAVPSRSSPRSARRGGRRGAIPGLPVTDTLKQLAPGPSAVVAATLDRADGGRGADPAGVHAPTRCAARTHGGAEATDDAALVEAIGGRVVVVDGEPENRKLTTREDLDAIVATLARR